MNWISVEDRLPELPCLTYWTDGTIEAYNKVDTVTVDDLMGCDDYSVKLSHWMPLPDPPNKEMT